MRMIVTRVLAVFFLLAIVTYLLPERQDTAANEPDNQNARAVRSSSAPMPKDLKIVENISYRQGNKKAWKLDLIMPRERGETKRPALVFVHGGGWSGGDKTQGMLNSGPIDYARKGYVCISVNYRLTREAPFPACLEDVKCSVRWLRAHAEKYNVDPNRIGGYGNSAGAHLVSLLGLVEKESNLEGDGPWQDQSSLLNAVCASATPTDFTSWPGGLVQKRRLRKFLEGSDASLREQVAKASPISYVHADAPPFLLFQGTRDRQVDAAQSNRFVKALEAAGAKDVTYHLYPGSGHSVFIQKRKKTYPLMEAFFERTLLNPANEVTPSISKTTSEPTLVGAVHR